VATPESAINPMATGTVHGSAADSPVFPAKSGVIFTVADCGIAGSGNVLLSTTLQLTLRQTASYLGVNDTTIRRWINQRALPAHSVDERLYFNPVELWEWAVEAGVPVSRALLEDARRSPDEVPPLAELLREGGIFHDVEGGTKHQILTAFVERLPLPPEQDRRFLLEVLEAREALGSTGIGDGIAIPHVRNPIVLHVARPFLTLCLLRNPVEFGALDGKPVHALFMVVSPTVPMHLRILARLGFVLRDSTLRQMLGSGADADQVLDRLDFIETSRNTGSFQVPPREPAE
jgi:nitrogen PTS system EIIA component